jgi:hypothetical protein
MLWLPLQIIAQPYYLKGIINDAETGDPLVFVNMELKNSHSGTITSEKGAFLLKAPLKNDTLLISSVGYSSLSIPVKANQNQYFTLTMESEAIEISQIDVVPGENPAFEILKQINKHKDENDYFNYPELQMKVYNKLSFSLNNVSEKLFKNKALKPFDFMLQYADTSDFTGKKILPVFLSETVSDFYMQNNPKKTQEVILANKMSGVENKTYSQFAGQIYADLDIYQSIIPLFEKNFINPVAPYARPYYKFYLIDSLLVGNDSCYYISFKPRFKRELTFSGDMYIEKHSYAIKKIKVRISPSANINYVKDAQAEILFEKVDGKWFPKTSTLDVLLELTEKQISVFAHKTTEYSEQKSTIKNKKSIFADNYSDVRTAQDIFKPEDYWDNQRNGQLDNLDQNVYGMVDTLMQNRRFQFYRKMTTMLYLGYYEVGNFEYGPYYSCYSNNAIEGNRFRLGGRTSNQFSTKFMIGGYGAFGDKDHKFKYGVNGIYLLNKEPRMSLEANWRDDMTQLSVSSNQFSADNISNSIFSVSKNTDLLRIQAAGLTFFREWPKGFQSNVLLNYRTIYPSFYMPFTDQISSTNFPQIVDASVGLNIRYAYGEKYLEGEFERTAIPSDFPVINFNATVGNALINNKTYSYTKLELTYDHNFLAGIFGYFEYNLAAGKIIGALPYPLLKLHSGNETYYLDNLAFNLMNYYEFASDIYAQANLTHHFDGFILSKIPLVNTLNLRSLVFARGVIGTLNSQNQSIMEFQGALGVLNGKPYIEAGFGIENIIKILRVDAIWRVTYRDNPYAQKFGIRAQFQLIL